MGDTDAGRRAQRRAFIRAHHPDTGGDPAAFITGLARLDAGAPPPDEVPSRPVSVRRRRSALVRLTDASLRRRRRPRRPR